jgi:hypothetical protein
LRVDTLASPHPPPFFVDRLLPKSPQLGSRRLDVEPAQDIKERHGESMLAPPGHSTEPRFTGNPPERFFAVTPTDFLTSASP